MRHRGWRAWLAAVGLATAFCADAALVHWRLEGVVFDDGTAATGTVTFDEASARVVLWNIRTEGGAGSSS